mmetsp:Transcript_1843/g.7697  ORF Transcript_1843/g.7697 Transcript_1843/m.7697 type:complete len:367 (+) Transcript_1843:3484-4584(+)
MAAASEVRCASALDAPGEVVDFFIAASAAVAVVATAGCCGRGCGCGLSDAVGSGIIALLPASGFDSPLAGAVSVAVLAADALADFSDFSNFSVPRASVASTDLAASDGDDLSADAFTAGAGLASAPVKAAAPGDRADVGALDGGVPETSSPPGADADADPLPPSFSSSLSTFSSTRTTRSLSAAAAVSFTFSTTTANFPSDRTASMYVSNPADWFNVLAGFTYPSGMFASFSGPASWNAIKHPTTYPMRRIPFTVPRRPGGDTSDRYTGTICVDAPTPAPVMNRPSIIVQSEFAAPQTRVPSANGIVVATSALRRPSLSANGPMPSPPANPPTTMMETTAPLAKLSPPKPKSSAMSTRGALMTAEW